jgi:hypothetical protein
MMNVSYPIALFGSLGLIVGLIAGLCFIFWEPLIGIPLETEPGWYRDYAGRRIPEIQDQDLFYHNIGPSVAAARAADIVILGPSFTTWGFDRDRLRQFGETHRLKTYNMSFIGIRSGEFSRRVSERWNIRAPIWIINVDDQFEHFFSRSPDAYLLAGGGTEPIRTLQYSRLHGLLSVVSRTLKWRFEDWKAGQPDGHTARSGFYRSIATGDVDLNFDQRYLADDNVVLDVDREPNCHVSPETIAIGREFLNSLGGSAVLTLVPHRRYCPLQAQELADALGVEAIVPPFQGYSTVDGGGHLDKKSAAKFTEFVMSRLVETDAYKRAFGAAPAAGTGSQR